MSRSILFHLGILFLFFLVSLPVILPFFHLGYFPTHDGEWAVVRLTDMFRILRDLQIPARYSENLNFGYGYPLFNFTYPFPYYLGVFIHLLGIGFVDVIKVLFASSVFFSAFFMFLASKNLWKNTWSGIVSSIMYIYFPYRMIDLYVRGSVGESISLAIFPLLFYLGVRFINRTSILLACAIGISVAVLIMTHNIMSVFFMPIFVMFFLAKIILEKKKALKLFALSIFLGLGISVFFWIPALFEKGYILLSRVPIADRNLYFVKLEQLLFPRWGYDVPTGPNGFSYQLGSMHLALFILVLLSLGFTLFKDNNKLKRNSVQIASLLIIVTSFFIFLLFKQSAFFWKNLPLLSEINYPWTLLGPIGFLVSLAGGFLCINKITRYIAIFLSIGAILLVLPYAKPERFFDKGDNYYITNDATTTSSNELMPLWVKKMPIERVKGKLEIISGKGILSNVFFNSREVKFSANISSGATVRINTIYYPGWKVNIDTKDAFISYSNEKGVMDVRVPSGNHVVNARFGETRLRIISNIISLLSIFISLLMLVVASRKLLFKL